MKLREVHQHPDDMLTIRKLPELKREVGGVGRPLHQVHAQGRQQGHDGAGGGGGGSSREGERDRDKIKRQVTQVCMACPLLNVACIPL